MAHFLIRLIEEAFLGEKEVAAEEIENNGKFITIQAAVKVKGSFSVRVSMERIEKAPDSVALKNHDEKPVIPGTSWAGVFRHHMQEILGHILNESKVKIRKKLTGSSVWEK